MITREADYALRAVYYLAQNYGSGPVSTTDTGNAMDIPYRFLRKISRELVLTGLAVAQRGKRGGLSLARHPEQITLFDVIKIFDKRFLALNHCCADDLYCDRVDECPVHHHFADLQNMISERLGRVSFAQLIADQKSCMSKQSGV